MMPRVWYIPSFYGDIRLEASGDNTTTLHAESLTPAEADAIRTLREQHCEDKLMSPAWATREMWNRAGIEGERGSPYRSNASQAIELAAPVTKVERALASVLKPARKVVRAVVFRASSDSAEVVSAETAEKKKAEPAAGATVATPTKGCPIPDFDEMNVRATRVLKNFLTRVQLTDFERQQQFLVTATDTGTRYLLTSRNAGRRFEAVGRSSVFDLDRNMSVCVHDWSVPAAEELLALLVHFLLPGGERFMLQLPHEA